MKTTIRTLAIAIITPIALILTLSVSHGLAHKVEHARSIAAVSAQPGQEMFNGSYSTMINTLNAVSVR